MALQRPSLKITFSVLNKTVDFGEGFGLTDPNAQDPFPA
jgi:hypothetical protein